MARREDARILRGRTRYLDDIELPRQAHAAFVRSIHARARVTAVRAPEAADGLVAVLTGEDLGGRVRPFPVQTPDGATVAAAGHPVLAGGEVRYAGEPIALVVAESRALAEDAAELVEVDYEPYAAVTDPRAAGERLLEWSRTAGDVDGAFGRAAHVVRGAYGVPRLVAAPMETRGAIAAHDPGTDRLTIWCSAQDPHRPLAQLAHVLGRPDDTIRVVVPDVGGAFGSKGVVGAEVAAIAVAAIDLGRPVKWAEDRLENFQAAYQGRGMEGEVELALDADGRMLALRARLWADLGAYLYSTTAIPPHTAAMLMCGVYDIGAAEVELIGARTNKVPTGPYRGAGRPEAAYFLERAVDDAARAIGIDRVELRRRNLVRTFPHRTPLGWTYDSGDYDRCLDLALELAAEAPRGRRARRDGDRLGDVRGARRRPVGERGGDRRAERPRGHSQRLLAARAGTRDDVRADRGRPARRGDRRRRAALRRHGGGPARHRHFREPLDGDGRFRDRGRAGPDRGTRRRPGRTPARRRRGRGDLGRRGVHGSRRRYGLARGSGGGRLPAGQASGRRGRRPAGLGALPLAARLLLGRLRRDASRSTPRPASCASCTSPRSTTAARGRTRCWRTVRSLGGIAQGLGECLVEEAVHDENGQLRTASFADYSLLTAAEMPALAIGVVETPSPHNPLGAKGLGEGGAIGSLPAVTNAVADALGGRHVDPPFTEEKLWRALREVAGT